MGMDPAHAWTEKDLREDETLLVLKNGDAMRFYSEEARHGGDRSFALFRPRAVLGL